MRKIGLHDQTLDKITEIIIRTVSPDQIILFGSRARGESRPDSDYDILVIKKNIENERIITRQINYELFNQNINSEVDVIATSTEKWLKNSKNISYIYKDIETEGIILYE